MIRTIIVDDMPKARRLLNLLMKDMPEISVIADFPDAISAIEYIDKHEVDLIFMDIEMPVLNGIDAAKEISKRKNPPGIIFLTAYTEFSLDAWETEAIAYLLKPYEFNDISRAVEKFKATSPRYEQVPQLEVLCFPVFNVFIKGSPLYFKNKKAKEVMAYLVYHKGGWVDNLSLCYAVLEEMDEPLAKANLRTYVNRLKVTLEQFGISDIIEQSYGKIRIKTELFSCDYYEYLKGNTYLFSGEFLKEYSWAEPALATMINASMSDLS
ncbi:MAG: response regulator [Lachnospiraceae bacterium]